MAKKIREQEQKRKSDDKRLKRVMRQERRATNDEPAEQIRDRFEMDQIA